MNHPFDSFLKRGAFTLAWALVLVAVPSPAAGPKVKSSFFTTSDGVRLHYLDAGSGPAIVFVPGWTMPAEIWEPQIRGLSGRYRVVALDPRSQGESAQTTEGHYPERRAQDIKELIEHLNLAPAVLVGWSLGVPEALTYVEQFGTTSLHALVLVDGRIGSDPNPEQSAQMWGWLTQLQVNRRQHAEQFVPWMFKKAQPEAYIKKLIATSLKTPTNTAFTLVANVFAGRDWRPVLPKIDKPVLYVVQPELKSQAEMLKEKLPSARIEIFAEAGHALFVDEAERFNAVLEDFLAASNP